LQYCSPQTIIPAKWIDTDVYNISKRIYSTFFNPNIFGFYINFIIILCSENFNFKKLNMEWIVYFTGVGCLILTFSRTSWISLILSLMISTILDKKYLKHALFTTSVIFMMNYYLKTGRTSIFNAVNDSSMLYRLEIWKVSLNIFTDNFISGIGFGTLSKHVAVYSDTVSANIEHTHNIYLQILVETGVLGASFCTYMLYNITKKLIIKMKGNNNAPWITAMTVLFMTLIHGIADSVPLSPQIMMILCIYAGILNNSYIGTKLRLT
jgi:O-antigen ligase